MPKIVIHRSCTSAPAECWADFEHLAAEIIVQTFSCKNPDTQISQRSSTSGPAGSWRRDHDRAISHKRSAHSDLAQVVLQDVDADVPTKRSCMRDPHPQILHKSLQKFTDLSTKPTQFCRLLCKIFRCFEKVLKIFDQSVQIRYKTLDNCRRSLKAVP